jgi:hypothetical protein
VATLLGVSPCLDWYSQQPFELKSGVDAWPALAPNPPTNRTVGEFKPTLKLSLRPVASSQSLTEQFLPVHDSALVPKRTGVKWPLLNPGLAWCHMTPAMDGFADRLRAAMVARGNMTMGQLERVAGLSDAYVTKILTHAPTATVPIARFMRAVVGFGGFGFGDIARVWPCFDQIKAAKSSRLFFLRSAC